MVCANLREISRSFLRESSRLRIFVRGVNAEKELFSWADLYIYSTAKETHIFTLSFYLIKNDILLFT